MAIYLAVEPDSGSPDERLERTLLLRDGFSLLCFIFPVPVLLFNRLWLEALAAFALTLFISLLGPAISGSTLASLLSLLINLFFALEFSDMRLRALQRRGHVLVGAIEAGSKDEAEMRFAASSFDRLQDSDQPMSKKPTSAASDKPGKSGNALGLVSFPVSR